MKIKRNTWKYKLSIIIILLFNLAALILSYNNLPFNLPDATVFYSHVYGVVIISGICTLTNTSIGDIILILSHLSLHIYFYI